MLFKKKIDLIYIELHGDVVEALTRWFNKEDLLSETSKTFSGQVFDFCKNKNLNTLAISAFSEEKSVNFKNFRAYSKPRLTFGGSIGYHLTQILFGIKILAIVIWHHPKYLHITTGTTHWFMLAPLKLFGIKIFPQFHNTFWPKGYPPLGRLQRIMLKLDAFFLKNIAKVAFCCSPEIKRQIEEITNKQNCPTYVFKAQFYRKNFQQPLPSPDIQAKPFVIVFAGRIERSKGVFDILSMAKQLKNENVLFHICGNGSDLDELKNACTESNLDGNVKIHGRLNRPELLDIYSQCHAVIVPTRSGFCEGLPLVVIEGILVGRPVITSELSNALDVLGPAIMEAKAENIDSYVTAIKQLSSNLSLFNQKQEACHAFREQFLNGAEGLEKILDHSL